MPMFVFQCDDCGHEFEELVFGSRLPQKCPKCTSEKIRKKVSTFSSKTGGGAAPSGGHSHKCSSFG